VPQRAARLVEPHLDGLGCHAEQRRDVPRRRRFEIVHPQHFLLLCAQLSEGATQGHLPLIRG